MQFKISSSVKYGFLAFRNAMISSSVNARAHMCILSTKYGLVDVEKIIEPYEETLENRKLRN